MYQNKEFLMVLILDIRDLTSNGTTEVRSKWLRKSRTTYFLEFVKLNRRPIEGLKACAAVVGFIIRPKVILLSVL